MPKVATKQKASETVDVTGAVAFADSAVVVMLLLGTKAGATCVGCTNPACTECVERRECLHSQLPYVIGFFDRDACEKAAYSLRARGYLAFCGKPRGYNVPFILLTNYTSPKLRKLPKVQMVGVLPGNGGAR